MAKAAAAEKFHSEGREEVYELLQDVIDKHHHSLNESHFLILMKHGGWKSKGKVVFGKPKVLGDDLRKVLRKDVILYLNADMWSVLSEPQKRYVLDNALFTLDLKEDKNGDVKEARDGRPLLTTVPPDIEGFAAVIKRHGVIMEDVKRLALALKETNAQLTIEDAAAEAAPEEPREGVRGTINPDGTINLSSSDEFDEQNQVTLDQVLVADPEEASPGLEDSEAAELAEAEASESNDDDLPDF